ncbi:MAG: carbohydrate binding family 9 domain-containing protein [Acidobacteria bacterium]|nr:carbohydrate binding family 9 domain-containing protein [Acidobacteriota bacterium]
MRHETFSLLLLWGSCFAPHDGVLAAAVPSTTEKVAIAIRVNKPPHVDGLLNEDSWESVPKSTDFLQRDPHEGEPASEATEVKILYTNQSLFFGITCYDSDPAAVLARELQRDSAFDNDDNISILLDTFHDHRSAFLFRTNPLGAQYDALITDEGRVTNVNWDEKWNVAAGITPQGWAVEIEVPFKTLRVTQQQEQLWGIDFERIIRRKNEFTYWSNYKRGFTFQQVSQAGHLRGLENLQAGLTWRIKPFMKASLSRTYFGDGTPSDFDFSPTVGLEDIKYRVTSNFTLDLTANTDFAETDVDEQVLNLTRFPAFFPEKREFFLEGAGIFDYGPGGGAASELKLFFSRRIGLSPSGESVPILWGTKFIGKAKRWTLGLIDAATDDFQNIPRRNFSVFRVKKDLLARSNVGAIFTNRSSTGGDDPYNRAAGLDANFTFADHFNLTGFVTGSFSPEKNKDNWAGRVRSFWDSDLLLLNVEHMIIQRNFNPEMGWLPRKDMQKTKLQFDLKPRPNSRVVRQFMFRTNFDYIANQAGQLETRSQDVTFETVFQSGDRFSAKYSSIFDRIRRPFQIQNLVTVPGGDYHWRSFVLSYFPSSHRNVSGSVTFRGEWGFYGGTNFQTVWQPLIKLGKNLSLNPAYQFSKVSLAEGGFRSHLINSKISYAFNTRWLTSTTFQYNSAGSFAGINFRLNYIYRPGDNFFLVYNEFRTLAAASTPGGINRALIAKLTHSFDF